ncbi:MAG: hypothetical protein WCY97_08345 [Methanothrix sp.]
MREGYPELIPELTPAYASSMLADEPLLVSKFLSKEQLNELAVMEMDLQVAIAEKELDLANKARDMMRKSMRTK